MVLHKNDNIAFPKSHHFTLPPAMHQDVTPIAARMFIYLLTSKGVKKKNQSSFTIPGHLCFSHMATFQDPNRGLSNP